MLTVANNGTSTTREKVPNTLAGVAAPVKQGPAEGDKPLQSLAIHQTNVFDSLRASIKLVGDMFAFGKPTPDIVLLMSKIYHENVIRLLADLSDVDGKEPHYDEKGNRDDRLKCMFGILQDTDDNLYVTISESPGFDDVPDSATDLDFMRKRMMMMNILKSANIKVSFPEERTFPIDPIPSSIRWRKGALGGDNWDTLVNVSDIRKKIKEKNMKDVIFIDPQYNEDNENMYNAEIRQAKMNLYWIDSWEYLRNRRTNPTFRPYKKYKLAKNGSTWQAECNNGHLCTESKLFAYAAQNGIKVKSFVAYWIGGDLPPENHIIRGYSYRTMATDGEKKGKNEKALTDLDKTIKKEDGLLIYLARACYNLIDTDRPYRELHKSSPDKYMKIFKNIVQPCAVACPGCFANIQAYKEGKMNIWDMSNCYAPRRALKMTGGAKKRNKTQKHRKAKKGTRKNY